jgi:hypothetical protein
MKVEENEMGGQTVSLTLGDDLREVPRSHRKLVTPEIAAVFRDAPNYFSSIAERTPFRSMADWLMALVWENSWRLELERAGDDKKWGRTAFRWTSKTIRGAGIGLPMEVDTNAFPAALATLYRLIGYVDWAGGAAEGQIAPATAAYLISSYDFNYSGDPINPDRTAVWGGQNGDMLIADLDSDRGGWFDLPENRVHMVGTVADTVNWVFAELLAGRVPDSENLHH